MDGAVSRARALAIVLVALWACGPGTPRPGDLRGVALAAPWAKPDFVLTDTDGAAFDFRAATAGTVTMLFFGFTECPDICPVQLANLAAALDKQPGEVARAVRVVFVTTDPERDTPERVRSWLNGFSRDFVGLVGPIDSVNAIQQRIGLAPAVRIPLEDDDYTIGHAAQIVAYTADERAHVVYPSGVRQDDWAHDLPLLVRGQWGARP
jgi:protein SCO1/2